MTDAVRWNGHKGHRLVILAEDSAPSEKESSFFVALRALDAELDGRERTATEDEFLTQMRAYLDELEDALKNPKQ